MAATQHNLVPNIMPQLPDQLVPETVAQTVLRLSGVIGDMQGRLTTTETRLSTSEGKLLIAEKKLADMAVEVGRQGMLFVPLDSNAALQLIAITDLSKNVVGLSAGHTSAIDILSGRLAGIDTQLVNLDVASKAQSATALAQAQGSPAANLAAIQVNTSAVAGLHHSFHTLQAEVKVLIAAVKAQEDEKREKAAATAAPGPRGKESSGDKHEDNNGSTQSLNRESR